MSPADLAECFETYRPVGYTARRPELNLRNKLKSVSFREELRPLVGEWHDGYDIDRAGALILEEVLPLL